ncbi:MAG: hypothetical protein Q8910_00770 [Bacteroidota bacterium]|nr:hypothetical protein [Bacteroidota bacterium]
MKRRFPAFHISFCEHNFEWRLHEMVQFLDPSPNHNTGYTFLKWNGKYGDDSKFVVRDNKNGKQSLFTPGRPEDLMWANTDLTQDPDISEWQEFGDETVDDLTDVAF